MAWFEQLGWKVEKGKGGRETWILTAPCSAHAFASLSELWAWFEQECRFAVIDEAGIAVLENAALSPTDPHHAEMNRWISTLGQSALPEEMHWRIAAAMDMASCRSLPKQWRQNVIEGILPAPFQQQCTDYDEISRRLAQRAVRDLNVALPTSAGERITGRL